MTIPNKANEDADIPTKVTMNAQSALKGMVDDTYWMADDIGVEGVQKLDSISNELRSWSNMKHNENKKKREENFVVENLTSKNVPMTSNPYTSNVKRVCNTHHM